MKRPLFEALPGLKRKIPNMAIAKLPTPIEALPQLAPNLWVKRDDKSNTLYGGNKVRKLEFILADVIQSKKKKILTFGAIGTNHGVATSIYCLQIDIACKLLLFNQPVSLGVQQNLKLMHRFNAELVYKGSLLRTVMAYYWQKLFQKKDTYYLFAGGSNVAGCLSFVNAAFELRQQIEAGLVPEPDIICVAVGSSSTLAGLSLGCSLAGLKSKLIGVRVAPSHIGPIPTCTRGSITKLRSQTYKHLCQIEPNLKGKPLPEIHLDNSHFGSGYGRPSPEGNWAMQMFEQTDIKLDGTYTAKTAAAALSLCAAQPDKNILYWHTYNSADVSHLAERADIGSMPPSLQRFVKAPLHERADP